MKISFIGYGNMAKAIARGLIKQGGFSISAASPSLTQGVNQEQIKTYPNNPDAIKDADVIILSVKPKMMSSVLKDIIPHLPPHCVLISVAAGLSLSWFAEQGIKNHALIRTMPNTPAALGLSATALIANAHTNEQQKQTAELIFNSIGLISWIDKEEDMDTITALSGSGPAYVFLFMESMIEAAVALGLDSSVARLFTLQTIEGAVKLAQNSDLSLNQLRTRVTSPGGTTEVALSILQGRLEDLMLMAMNAAKQRAEELRSTKN